MTTAIIAFVKAHWRLLSAIVLMAVWSMMLVEYGRNWSDTQWQAKWTERDLADAKAAQEFTEKQRRIELQRQGAIDGIQAEAEKEIAKSQRNAAISAAESKRLQDGIADAIARLQADSSNPGATTSSKTRASTSSMLTVLFREIDTAAGNYAAEADRARGAGLRCEAAYDAVRATKEK